MLKLLIVEDERIIRNGLENRVPWETLGIDEVYAVENADKALELSEEHNIDIVVSDIHMPGMNGVELCRKLREGFPHCQIVFISGYSDKEYLKAAISLGAVSYVEKPIDIDELMEAVREATGRVKQTARNQQTILRALLAPVPDLISEEEPLRRDNEFRIVLMKRKVAARALEALAELCGNAVMQSCGEKVHFIADYAPDGNLALLLSGEAYLTDERMTQLCEILLGMRTAQDEWFLAVGEAVDTLEKIKNSYQNATYALGALAYKGWNTYAFYKEEVNSYQGQMSVTDVNTFRRYLMDKRTEDARQYVNFWYEKFIAARTDLSFGVKSAYCTLNYVISQVADIRHVKCVGEVQTDRLLMDAKTIKELHEFTDNRICCFGEEDREDVKGGACVKKVMDYMKEHVADTKLSISLLADEVYLTPTYLSALFKKTTGVTIGQYLTELRVEKAKELLADPTWKLYQIAEMVGYEDANYFTKIFKKNTGMLPSEYRENYLN